MSSSTRTHWFIRGCALAAFLAFFAHVVQSLLLWSEEPTVNPGLLLLGMLGALAGIAALYSLQRDSEDYWMLPSSRERAARLLRSFGTKARSLKLARPLQTLCPRSSVRVS